MIGKTISHYKILAKLGEGGMGVVFHAEDLTLKRDVALKFLPVHALDDDEQRTRLVREAQAAAALEHININTVYEIDEVDGQTFIAMAFIRGQTLKEKIKEGQLPIDTALSYAIQIASGLNKAHSQGIVHRDIKPANVLVTDEGIIKIVDFGLAKLAGATGLTKTDSTIGTAAYMSPEQAQGQVVDHRTDIWSLGVMLYEMLAGRRPFRGEHEAVMVYSILNEEYESLSSSRDDIPEQVVEVINRALTKKPAERYQNIAEMLEDLRELLGETPADVTGPLSSRSRRAAAAIPPPKKSLPIPMIVGAAVVAVAAVIAGFLFFGSESPPTAPSGEPEMAEAPTGFYGESLLTAFVMDSSGEGSMATDTLAAMAMADTTVADSTLDSLGIPTVAVLYLENLSGNSDDNYFADGLTEDIINDLSCIHSLRVLSAPEVADFRDRGQGILKIGQALASDYLLNASVRRAKDELHVIAQLLKVDDGTLIWNERFDRKPADLFAIRREIASGITGAMNLEMTGPETERVGRVPTRNMEAYDDYLQARALNHRHTKDANNDAEKSLRRALKRDPSLVPAMCELASVYIERITRAWDLDAKAMSEMNDLLGRARAVDPTSADLHRTLAMKYVLTGEYDRALAAAQRLVEIHPYSAYAHYVLGETLYLNGKSPDARRELDSARVLNPRLSEAYLVLNRIAHESGRTTEAGQQLAKALDLKPKSADVLAYAGRYALTRGDFAEAVGRMQSASGLRAGSSVLAGQLGIAQLFAGKTAEAITLLKEAADKSDLPQFYWYLGWAYRLQKEDKDARKAFEKCVEADQALRAFNPNTLENTYRLTWAKFLANEISDLQAEVDRLETVSLQTTNPSSKPYYLAGIYATLGDQERALQLLGQVKKLNYYSSAYLAADPALASLRNNSEFRKLVGLDG